MYVELPEKSIQEAVSYDLPLDEITYTSNDSLYAFAKTFFRNLLYVFGFFEPVKTR
jgi:hypothetical protein